MTHLLFSYGTLQLKKVQFESFGRQLKGSTDSLLGYKLGEVKITDSEVLRKSEQEFHPAAISTKNQSDIIEGVLFEISEAELKKTDDYEQSDYKRIEVSFTSGKKGWIYVIA